MVDQQAHARTLEKRRERAKLRVPDLQRDAHVERLQLREQRLRREVMLDAVMRRVERDTDNAPLAQREELALADAVRNHGNSLVAPATALDRVEKAAVVLLVARVRSDDQSVAHAVRVVHLRKLQRRSHLLARRTIERVLAIREAGGIEHMAVAIDLRLVEDGHRGGRLSATRRSPARAA